MLLILKKERRKEENDEAMDFFLSLRTIYINVCRSNIFSGLLSLNYIFLSKKFKHKILLKINEFNFKVRRSTIRLTYFFISFYRF